jgi:hypothetical protein
MYISVDEHEFFGENETSFLRNPRVWKSGRDIPDDVKYRMLVARAPEPRYRDYATPMLLGKSWLFELTEKFQPRTGKILKEHGDLWLRCIQTDGGQLFYMGLSVKNKVVILRRDDAEYNFSDEKMASFIPGIERYLCLPEPIRLAYYNRFIGLKIPDSPSPGITGRLLPNNFAEWPSWDSYLAEFKGYKKLYLPWLAERIADVAPKRKSAPWTRFMSFLDSRPDNRGKEGDQLFVKTHIHDGLIYHIKDADIENMRILEDPVEAIDRYCEHVLLENAGRFDFLPFTVPMS